jgi:PadR family transcriptional regulator PadR
VTHTVLNTLCAARLMPIDDDTFEKLRLELRRGSLVLAVLAALKVERYGYTLRGELAEAGLGIEEGALYPMLRRLESQGLLTSEWREEEKRNKRFYRLSDDGAALLEALAGEWRAINASLNRLL